MALLDPVYLTCESVGSGAFREPWNVLSNAVFFIVAWLLWRDYGNTKKSFDEERLTLVILITLIGCGGVAFHSVGNYLSLFADLAPLAMFVTFVIYVALRRMLGIGLKQTVLLLSGFAIVQALTMTIPEAYRLNDAIAYFPWLGMMAGIGWLLSQRGNAAAAAYLQASAVLAVSLVFRSMDNAVCESVPTGTHFLWHLGLGLTLFLLAGTIVERRTQYRMAEGKG